MSNLSKPISINVKSIFKPHIKYKNNWKFTKINLFVFDEWISKKKFTWTAGHQFMSHSHLIYCITKQTSKQFYIVSFFWVTNQLFCSSVWYWDKNRFNNNRNIINVKRIRNLVLKNTAIIYCLEHWKVMVTNLSHMTFVPFHSKFWAEIRMSINLFSMLMELVFHNLFLNSGFPLMHSFSFGILCSLYYFCINSAIRRDWSIKVQLTSNE